MIDKPDIEKEEDLDKQIELIIEKLQPVFDELDDD